MRLNEKEIEAVKNAVRTHFGDQVRIFLFGSRVNDAKAGGDIDILIEHGETLKGSRLIRAKLKAMTDIQFALGERKIDIITTTPGETAQPPLIVQQARKEAIEL
ncbi:MAG TPA: nucleotidyltransferase domain-containing protein [Sediminispirochaeta sp.]|nr:nucleotidyltransferase domain-containing protein [Sediminispirochaeta sp.]